MNLLAKKNTSGGSGTPRQYRTIEELNEAIRNIRNISHLRLLYAQLMPGAPGYSRDRDYDSCGGTATVVVRFLTGQYMPMHILGSMQMLEAENNKVLLQKILQLAPPYYAWLESHDHDHVVIFARTGDRWGFYQSNDEEGMVGNFCFVPSLNLSRGIYRHYNRPNMNRDEFCGFFRELTKSGNNNTLFFGTSSFLQWKIGVVSFDGRSLLDG